MPLVFINLRYGLLSVLLMKPVVWGQGSDMSDITTYIHKLASPHSQDRDAGPDPRASAASPP